MYQVQEVKTTKKQDEAILRIVKEWLKGCACTETKPSDCEECTQGMVKAIEAEFFNDN